MVGYFMPVLSHKHRNAMLFFGRTMMSPAFGYAVVVSLL